MRIVSVQLKMTVTRSIFLNPLPSKLISPHFGSPWSAPL